MSDVALVAGKPPPSLLNRLRRRRGAAGPRVRGARRSRSAGRTQVPFPWLARDEIITAQGRREAR